MKDYLHIHMDAGGIWARMGEAKRASEFQRELTLAMVRAAARQDEPKKKGKEAA